MFKNVPVPLLVIVAIYLPIELTLIVISKNWVGLIPVGMVIVFFFSAVQGSRPASLIWGALCVLGALGAGYMAFQLMKMQHYAAPLLALYCLFFLASAGYLFFSPGLRRFLAQAPEKA